MLDLVSLLHRPMQDRSRGGGFGLLHRRRDNENEHWVLDLDERELKDHAAVRCMVALSLSTRC